MKDLRYASLTLLYGKLLTANQRALASDYFLLEISAERGLSRQSVNDGLKKAKEHLDAFEEILRLSERIGRLSAIADRIEGGESGKALAEELRAVFEES